MAMKQNGKVKPPELGARITASGYMVRYRPEIPDVDGHVSPICWKRRGQGIVGAYVGIRSLSIGWLFPFIDPEIGRCHKCRKVGSITVYAIAVNHRTARYVLPRDVLVGPAGSVLR